MRDRREERIKSIDLLPGSGTTNYGDILSHKRLRDDANKSRFTMRRETSSTGVVEAWKKT